MKDKALKPVIKSAKKTARAAIHLKIVSQLKAIAKEFGQDSEDLFHDFEKAAKKLAKKISEQIKIVSPAPIAAPKENKVVKTAPKPKSAAKPKPAVSEKKVAPPVKAVTTPAKKVTPKVVTAKPVKKEEPAKTKAKLPAKKS